MTTYDPGPINDRQESPQAKQYLRAMSRLYTLAKHTQQIRQVGVLVIAIVSVALGLTLADARAAVGALGTVVGFAFAIVTASIQRRWRSTAAAAQEEFDTDVYQLPWKDSLVDHPSPTDVAQAASRYKGNRFDTPWYPNTGPVARPLDILICQRSNLGWGVASHRAFANWLTGLAILLIVIAALIGVFVHESWTDWLLVVLPLLAPIADAFEQRQQHAESAETKTRADAKITALWSKGLGDHTAVTIGDCRDTQDLILNSRRSNADIPDGFDNRRRDKYEMTMTEAANQLIAQAIEHGRTTQ